MLKKIKDKVKVFFKRIINDIKNIRNWKYEKLIVTCLIPVGLLYILLMPPSQVPDEQAHILRSYEISEGILIANKNSKAIVPRDLLTKLKPNVENYTQLNENLNSKTDYTDRVELVDSAAPNPFILYQFSSIGFLTARLLGLNIIVGCYLGKIMNFIFFCIMAYYTLKIIPFGKYVFTVIMFMPMFLHQATSISADSVLNTTVMFFIAFVLYLFYKKENVSKKECIVLVVLSCLISVSKYVYTPIIFISAIMIWTKNMGKKQKITTLCLSFILPIFLAASYYLLTSNYESAFNEYLTTNNVDRIGQVQNIVNNPVGYISILKNTLRDNSLIYARQMVGSSLGWLCIDVTELSIDIFIFVLIASCFVEDNKVSLSIKQKMWSFTIAFSIILLILTAMYITWTGVGNNSIDGVQGRYFIPVLFLILLCLCKKSNYIKIKNIQYKLPFILIILNLPALYAIYRFFNI